MPNLLTETMEILADHGKTPSDVRWVGGGEHCSTWDDFAAIASFDYDNGFGGAEISPIVVVGDDWWLERGEYDGSEWWEFKALPVRPVAGKVLQKRNICEYL